MIYILIAIVALVVGVLCGTWRPRERVTLRAYLRANPWPRPNRESWRLPDPPPLTIGLASDKPKAHA